MKWRDLITLWIGLHNKAFFAPRSIWQHCKDRRIKRHGWTLLEIAG